MFGINYQVLALLGIIGGAFLFGGIMYYPWFKTLFHKHDNKKAVRLVASIMFLAFMFFEEIILKPLRKVKIIILEKTIKRMNGYATIGLLGTLKTIEGGCKIALPLAPNYWVALGIVVLDGVLGFISMNIIIHGHDNLEQFKWYIRFVAWLKGLKEEIQSKPFYKKNHAKVLELKTSAKEWGLRIWRSVFGQYNSRGVIRYASLMIRQKKWRKRRKN